MPLTLPFDPTKSQLDMKMGRILVVEDEELIRDAIAMSLIDEGYEVMTAEDGRVALDIIQQQKKLSDPRTARDGSFQASQFPEQDLDLIILDLMLPYVNGLDLCRLIRREGNDIPILMLSAKGSETDRVVGLEIGADDYLTKPFGMRELVARCRALLRRYNHSQIEPEQVCIDYQDITLYPQECRVTVRREEVSLSPKEFKILELFMSYPRRVWSRDQLLERIWGPDFIGDSKTVDVHIRWLREKLEIDPSNPEYIVTVRGFGYRFG